MSTINRRTFIKGTTAGSLFVLTLAGCSEKKDTPAKSAQTQGTAAGLKQASAKPHYVMVFDQNKCVGCGTCADICNSHIFVLVPKPTKHQPVCSVWP